MITSGKVFDLGMNLARIADHKNHTVDINQIKYILANGTINIIDYLEHDYGHLVNFEFFDKKSRDEISKIFQDRVLSIDFEYKWGIQKDGIVLLLALTLELATFMLEKYGKIETYSYEEYSKI